MSNDSNDSDSSTSNLSKCLHEYNNNIPTNALAIELNTKWHVINLYISPYNILLILNDNDNDGDIDDNKNVNINTKNVIIFIIGAFSYPIDMLLSHYLSLLIPIFL